MRHHVLIAVLAATALTPPAAPARADGRAAPAAAQKGAGDASPAALRRFYYDPHTRRHFSDGNPTFAVRPVGDDRYREAVEISVDEEAFRRFDGKLSLDREGAHRIRFRTADPHLHWNPVQDFTVYVDLSAPMTQAQWIGPNAPGDDGLTYVAPSARLMLLAEDYLAGVNHTRWSEGGRETAAPARIAPQGEGLHQARFASIDNVGNVEKWNDLKFFVDSKGPQTQAAVTGPISRIDNAVYAGSGARVQLTATDEGAGVERIEFQYNGGPVTPYHHPVALADPKAEIRFRAVDRVGNAETWKSLTVLEDAVPPRLAIAREGSYLSYGGRIYASPGFTLTLRAEDGESGVGKIVVARDGKTFEPLRDPKIVFSAPGAYEFRSQVTDRAGNSADGDSYMIQIDNEPPRTLASLGGQPVKPDESGSISVRVPERLDIRGEDSGVGMERIEISYDGKRFAPLAGPLDFATWNVTRRTLWYRGVDRLHNREPAHALAVRVLGMGGGSDLFVETRKLPDVPLSKVLKTAREAP